MSSILGLGSALCTWTKHFIWHSSAITLISDLWHARHQCKQCQFAEEKESANVQHKHSIPYKQICAVVQQEILGLSSVVDDNRVCHWYSVNIVLLAFFFTCQLILFASTGYMKLAVASMGSRRLPDAFPHWSAKLWDKNKHHCYSSSNHTKTFCNNVLQVTIFYKARVKPCDWILLSQLDQCLLYIETS